MVDIANRDQRSQADLNAKLVLERAFMLELLKLDQQLVRESTVSVLETGLPIDVQSVQGIALPVLLMLLYQRVTDKFKNNTGFDSLIAEQSLINQTLSNFTGEMAPKQAGIIIATTQRNSNRALERARQSQQQALLDGEQIFTERDVAVTFGVLLARQLQVRRPVIASQEVGVVAEAAKMTEVEVLMGEQPSLLVPTIRPSQTVKEWVTMGDSVVRPHHLAVDSIQVAANMPFIVNGQKLRFPRDTSLGATLNNTANCRCDAIYDLESVLSARQDIGDVA